MSSLQTRACSVKGPGDRGGRGSPAWPVLCVAVVLGYDVGRNGGPEPSSTLPGLVWGSGCRQGPGDQGGEHFHVGAPSGALALLGLEVTLWNPPPLEATPAQALQPPLGPQVWPGGGTTRTTPSGATPTWSGHGWACGGDAASRGRRMTTPDGSAACSPASGEAGGCCV